MKGKNVPNFNFDSIFILTFHEYKNVLKDFTILALLYVFSPKAAERQKNLKIPTRSGLTE